MQAKMWNEPLSLSNSTRNEGVDAREARCAALDLALVEAREEFVQRFRAGQLPVLAGECPGRVFAICPRRERSKDGACGGAGWVCYAEKTQASALPQISTVKSPQQIMGTLVKYHLAARLGLRCARVSASRATVVAHAPPHCRPEQVFHVSVMPCFDKKLEGSRDDFFNAAHGTRDVGLLRCGCAACAHSPAPRRSTACSAPRRWTSCSAAGPRAWTSSPTRRSTRSECPLLRCTLPACMACVVQIPGCCATRPIR